MLFSFTLSFSRSLFFFLTPIRCRFTFSNALTGSYHTPTSKTSISSSTTRSSLSMLNTNDTMMVWWRLVIRSIIWYLTRSYYRTGLWQNSHLKTVSVDASSLILYKPRYWFSSEVNNQGQWGGAEAWIHKWLRSLHPEVHRSYHLRDSYLWNDIK